MCMALAKLTSKGQVTIPKEIRQTLNLKTGDKIEIIVARKGEALIRPVSKKVDDIFGKLHRPSRESVSVQAMDDAISKRMKYSCN